MLSSYNRPFASFKAPLPPQAVPLSDLSKKQVHRTKLIGKQVVWENLPRTQVLVKCDWLTLTAPRCGWAGF